MKTRNYFENEIKPKMIQSKNNNIQTQKNDNM